MAGLEISLVALEPMRVASARAVGETPEQDAWAKLCQWAKPKGLLEDLKEHPVYGFNNPNPSPDRPDYGYEFWIRVEPETVPEGDIAVKDFPGGAYAVVRDVKLQEVGATWKKIACMIERGDFPHPWRHTNELEKPHDPLAPPGEMVFDLYLPIGE